MRTSGRSMAFVLCLGACLALLFASVQTSARQTPAPAAAASSDTRTTVQPVLDKYCVTCHNQRLRTAGLTLDAADVAAPAKNAELWERVIAKLRARSMPPAGLPRPDVATYDAAASSLERAIDSAWLAHPNPGRIGAVHRLNRVEYTNAIRDLFSLDVDVTSQLPGDETADGSFDNFADVLTISTSHLERYLSVARQVTRLAVGLPPMIPAADRFEIPLHVLQDDRQSDDLPLGSRGGIAVRYQFPADGEYAIKVRLRRQYQDYVMGMGWPQRLDVRVDGALAKRFTVGGEAKGRPAAASYAGDGEPGFAGDDSWEKYMQIEADAGLEIRMPMTAGAHMVSASFVREMWEPEGLPQPLQRGRVLTNDEIYMGHASVGALSISGPYRVGRSTRDTASRRALFICQPRRQSEERDCAAKMLTRVARMAYRRPATAADTRTLLEFFGRGRHDGGSFDAGIQFALERVLVDPDFLLRVYRDPPASRGTVSAQSYPLSELEVASRLSFFLWNSIPDERLLELAERKQLTKPDVLEQQTRRMLADPRAMSALVDNFGAQWLNLRRVREVIVHPDIYPDFDDSLLEAFEQETKLFLASTLREDRSVRDLLGADYTFVNERLARHYRIPGIYGSRFRRVTLPNLDQRGGLLGNGAILATTSYPERTSPVLRGKWLLDNILGTPPPPPPPGVSTTLTEPKAGTLPPTIRERLDEHRKSPTCASCHSLIDSLGFALENFDATGGWRTTDESGKAVDASGRTIGGDTLAGFTGLRTALLAQPQRFPSAVTSKLLAYALARRVEYFDQPAVRQIVNDAARDDYRWSSIIVGIVKSPTFLRRAPLGTRE
jgi:cytochrome c5